MVRLTAFRCVTLKPFDGQLHCRIFGGKHRSRFMDRVLVGPEWCGTNFRVCFKIPDRVAECDGVTFGVQLVQGSSVTGAASKNFEGLISPHQ